jgi:hypothetical protein
VFTIPAFSQARAFWYQWFLYSDAGAQAVRDDPVAFARIQWDTWSPPGWFDEAEFAATAASFASPDWGAITLNAYRDRLLPGEAHDPRYAGLERRLAQTELTTRPALMIQGGTGRGSGRSAAAPRRLTVTPRAGTAGTPRRPGSRRT